MRLAFGRHNKKEKKKKKKKKARRALSGFFFSSVQCNIEEAPKQRTSKFGPGSLLKHLWTVVVEEMQSLYDRKAVLDDCGNRDDRCARFLGLDSLFEVAAWVSEPTHILADAVGDGKKMPDCPKGQVLKATRKKRKRKEEERKEKKR